MGTAKESRMERLVYVLENANDWVSSGMLAKTVGTTERSIRNYIGELNEGGRYHIASSRQGYRLGKAPAASGASDGAAPGAGPDTAAPGPTLKQPAYTTNEQRMVYVVSHLANASAPVSVYDLSESLFISESTLASSVMPSVRKLAEQFGLTCTTRGYNVSLEGREQDKRRLLGHIAMRNSYGYFSSTKTLEEMFPGFDVRSILASLVKICQRSELFLNDYALSNLLVHVLVIIVRLTSNNELSERDDLIDAEALLEQFSQREAIMRCAASIASYFEREFGCSIPDIDYQQIILLVALSVERYNYDELSYESLSGLMDESFLAKVRGICVDTCRRYDIPQFDKTLLLQLTLHMFNAYQRAIYHVSYPNPLAPQIKKEHAPVYDMAVYFAHQFSQALGVEVSEDEIAFIAFHIGAYLERIQAPDSTASCVVIVESYHDFSRQLVEDIRTALGDEITFVAAMNCDDYLLSRPEADLVITTIDVPVSRGCKVLIGPILTKQNLRKIRSKLADVLEEKRMRAARLFLQRVLRPELFARNVYLNGDADAYIDYLGGLCVSHGYANEDYVRDVHLREKVSSTAFTDCLAVPHSINGYSERSFIAVLHNDTPIPWGRHNVRFVLLIGIEKNEMGLFRDALDLIIELFGSVDNTMRLLQTDGFDEFLDVFARDIS